MSNKEICPYGAWRSPITTDLIVSDSIGLGEIQLCDGNVYWIEMRPEEKGRYVVVRQNGKGEVQDLSPENFNVRTRVHEYGGGSYYIHGSTVFMTNFSDQRLYKQTGTDGPVPLTPDDEDVRFADFIFDERRKRLISVMEHHHPDFNEARNSIVAVDPVFASVEILVAGADFYSNPRLSPDGKQLSWICWRHPDMPWDATELWLADISDHGELHNARCVAGGKGESIFQPQWSPADELYFVSDRNGWWNIYTLDRGQCRCLVQMNAEFGVTQWSFRESTYAFRNESEIVCTWSQNGRSRLGVLNIHSGVLESIDVPYSDIESVQADQQQAVFLGASPEYFPEIVCLDLETRSTQVIQRSSSITIDSDFLSVGESIEFPTEDQQTAFAFFYPPQNPNFVAPENEKPPLLVCSHGGPTGMSRNGLKLVFQYFTSRGIAVLDVNYGGSSGFGRAYRKRLDGNWGIVDVDDCVNAALFMVKQGRVDADRLAIRGGSAGGFTTLAALTFRNVFKAGASRYGVSDLEALTRDTHKFESRYLDGLIGPYPEQARLYKERSPIHAVDKLSCPVIFLQGLEDKIVLPNQSEMMVEALNKKGLPVAYLPFAGEQHGFRQSDNIKRALDAELYFFAKVFGFEPADEIEPVNIQNLS